jgi:ectonucleotide pyrophosphatase/phosphodiesterase family member 4
MMRNLNSLLFTTLLLLLISCGHQVQQEKYKTDFELLKENATDKLNHPYVVMISIDGFRHDYIDMYKPPFLSQIQNIGFRTQSLTPIFPSKTFPNHYSLITGLYSDQHKLVANHFYDPERKEEYSLGKPMTQDGSWYGGEPIWTSVKKQGLLSASYFWVSSDANIEDSYPSYYFPYKQSTPNETRTQQIVDWLKMPAAQRPHFLTLYFSLVDSAGHRFGPRSEQVKDAVLTVDQLISDMVSQLEQLNLPIHYVIVSDHGMKTINPKKAIFIKDYFNSDLVKFYERGPLTLGYFQEGTTKKQKDKIYKELKMIPGARLFKRENRPKEWHYSKLPRQGDFLLLASNGSYIFPKAEPKDYKNEEGKIDLSGGTHGYDPKESPEMGGIFLSFGPRVKKMGIVPATKNVNVYPYVLELLNLKTLAPIDGELKPLRPYLK